MSNIEVINLLSDSDADDDVVPVISSAAPRKEQTVSSGPAEPTSIAEFEKARSRRRKQASDVHSAVQKIDKDLRMLLVKCTSKRLMSLFQEYVGYLKEIIMEIHKQQYKCHTLAVDISRKLFLIRQLCQEHLSDKNYYHHKMSELLGIYTFLILRSVTFNMRCKAAERIIAHINFHLEGADFSFKLRVFIHIPYVGKEFTVVDKVLSRLIPEPTLMLKKELNDRLFIQYLIAFYHWKESVDDITEQERIISFANRFMKPKTTLKSNLHYAQHLPGYPKRDDAVAYFLSNVVFFNDIRMAALLDGAAEAAPNLIDLCDDMDDLSVSQPLIVEKQEVIIPPVVIKQEVTETMGIIDTVDLTNGDEEPPWLATLIRRAIETEVKLPRSMVAQNSQSCTIIDLDASDDDAWGVEINPISEEAIEIDSNSNDDCQTQNNQFHDESSCDSLLDQFSTNNNCTSKKVNDSIPAKETQPEAFQEVVNECSLPSTSSFPDLHDVTSQSIDVTESHMEDVTLPAYGDMTPLNDNFSDPFDEFDDQIGSFLKPPSKTYLKSPVSKRLQSCSGENGIGKESTVEKSTTMDNTKTKASTPSNEISESVNVVFSSGKVAPLQEESNLIGSFTPNYTGATENTELEPSERPAVIFSMKGRRMSVLGPSHPMPEFEDTSDKPEDNSNKGKSSLVAKPLPEKPVSKVKTLRFAEKTEVREIPAREPTPPENVNPTTPDHNLTKTSINTSSGMPTINTPASKKYYDHIKTTLNKTIQTRHIYAPSSSSSSSPSSSPDLSNDDNEVLRPTPPIIKPIPEKRISIPKKRPKKESSASLSSSLSNKEAIKSAQSTGMQTLSSFSKNKSNLSVFNNLNDKNDKKESLSNRKNISLSHPIVKIKKTKCTPHFINNIITEKKNSVENIIPSPSLSNTSDDQPKSEEQTDEETVEEGSITTDEVLVAAKILANGIRFDSPITTTHEIKPIESSTKENPDQESDSKSVIPVDPCNGNKVKSSVSPLSPCSDNKVNSSVSPSSIDNPLEKPIKINTSLSLTAGPSLLSPGDSENSDSIDEITSRRKRVQSLDDFDFFFRDDSPNNAKPLITDAQIPLPLKKRRKLSEYGDEALQCKEEDETLSENHETNSTPLNLSIEPKRPSNKDSSNDVPEETLSYPSEPMLSIAHFEGEKYRERIKETPPKRSFPTAPPPSYSDVVRDCQTTAVHQQSTQLPTMQTINILNPLQGTIISTNPHPTTISIYEAHPNGTTTNMYPSSSQPVNMSYTDLLAKLFPNVFPDSNTKKQGNYEEMLLKYLEEKRIVIGGSSNGGSAKRTSSVSKSSLTSTKNSSIKITVPPPASASSSKSRSAPRKNSQIRIATPSPVPSTKSRSNKTNAAKTKTNPTSPSPKSSKSRTISRKNGLTKSFPRPASTSVSDFSLNDEKLNKLKPVIVAERVSANVFITKSQTYLEESPGHFVLKRPVIVTTKNITKKSEKSAIKKEFSIKKESHNECKSSENLIENTEDLLKKNTSNSFNSTLDNRLEVTTPQLNEKPSEGKTIDLPNTNLPPDSNFILDTRLESYALEVAQPSEEEPIHHQNTNQSPVFNDTLNNRFETETPQLAQHTEEESLHLQDTNIPPSLDIILENRLATETSHVNSQPEEETTLHQKECPTLSVPDETQVCSPPRKQVKVRLKRLSMKDYTIVSNTINEDMAEEADNRMTPEILNDDTAAEKKRRFKKSLVKKGEALKRIFERSDSVKNVDNHNCPEEALEKRLLNGETITTTLPPSPPLTDQKNSSSDDTSQDGEISIPAIKSSELNNNFLSSTSTLASSSARKRFYLGLHSPIHIHRERKYSNENMSSTCYAGVSSTGASSWRGKPKRRKTICHDPHYLTGSPFLADEDICSTKAAADSPTLEVMKLHSSKRASFTIQKPSLALVSTTCESDREAEAAQEANTRISPTPSQQPINTESLSTIQETTSPAQTEIPEQMTVLNSTPAMNECESPIDTARSLVVSRTYSKHDMVQQVFVPPEIEKFIEEPTSTSSIDDSTILPSSTTEFDAPIIVATCPNKTRKKVRKSNNNSESNNKVVAEKKVKEKKAKKAPKNGRKRKMKQREEP